jgi:hypothetical protein
LLQIRNRELVDVLPEITLREISEYELWNLPDVSQTPVLVVANFEWGENETHYGSNHRFRVKSYTMQPSGEYGLSDEYVTTNAYDPNLPNMEVLATERPTVLARLRQTTATTVATEGAAAAATEQTPGEQINSLLHDWVESFRQKDVAKQVECYAPQLDIYYRKHNVSRAFVEADKSWAMARIAEIQKFELTNVNVSIDSADAATVTFDKSWDTTLTSGRRFAGSEMERLRLTIIGGGWKIKSEEELTIYNVTR